MALTNAFQLSRCSMPEPQTAQKVGELNRALLRERSQMGVPFTRSVNCDAGAEERELALRVLPLEEEVAA